MSKKEFWGEECNDLRKFRGKWLKDKKLVTNYQTFKEEQHQRKIL